MRGKTIVITGGTSGIGEVAAVALARMGARIVLVAEITFVLMRPSLGFARVGLVSPIPFILPISCAWRRSSALRLRSPIASHVSTS
jgi:hypothetical protein